MLDVNSVSITGYLEHLKYSQDKKTMYLCVCQNVCGKVLSRYVICVPSTACEGVKKKHLRKNDRVFITNAQLYEVKGDLRLRILSPDQIEIIERENKNQGDANADEFM